MISEISIRDLGVIESARMALSPGFTAVTGETGAGKTMVVTALGLLLGDRADSSVVRHGSDKAVVEGRWSTALADVVARVEELGGDVDDGELVVTRTVNSEGRSRAALGGVGAPISALASVGEHLVAIHGQSDQIRLKSPVAQRAALDRFASGISDVPFARYSELFASWGDARTRREQLVRSSEARRAEASELREAVLEIEGVAPVAGEDVLLRERAERLANSDDLRRAAHEAHEALASDEAGLDAVQLVETARRALERVVGVDPALETLVTQISEASLMIREASQSVAHYANGLEFDDGDVDGLHERSAAISALVRKFGPTLDDVLALQASASDRLWELDRTDDEIGELDARIGALEAELDSVATVITARRQAAAELLSQRVSDEIHALAMPTAQFVVRVQTGDEFTSFGRDSVEFLLMPHPGADPRPVAKGASGGELSRIMLAIEVVIAGTDSVPTLVFDEVDAGVGGASALEIGRRLATLSQSAQVIVVTHLAQVAAFADTHLNIVKDTSGDITESTITNLAGETRVSEVARLLSGTPDSDNARAHASELLEMARDFRTSLAP